MRGDRQHNMNNKYHATLLWRSLAVACIALLFIFNDIAFRLHAGNGLAISPEGSQEIQASSAPLLQVPIEILPVQLQKADELALGHPENRIVEKRIRPQNRQGRAEKTLLFFLPLVTSALILRAWVIVIFQEFISFRKNYIVTYIFHQQDQCR